ncbi:MAG: hypothetical protein WC940_01225 [Candidatus Paceibacterota bacterium]|jgi:hypothetical protein
MNWLSTFLFLILRPVLGLIILAGLLIYWIIKKKLPKEKYLKIAFYFFSGVIIIRSLVLTFLNYWLWSQELISQRLLPPYTPISYFLKYSWQNYWFEPVVSILLAFIVFWGIYLFNKKFEENLFYKEERYLAGLGVLATGWPNCLIFLSLVLCLGIVFHLLNILFFFVRQKYWIKDQVEKNKLRFDHLRLSLLYFWIPIALLVLLFSDIINRYIGISQFNI